VISEAIKNSAVSNALSSVMTDRRFPSNVFVGDWEDYLFFESSLMFDASFIDVKDVLLREEKSSAIALINLGSKITFDNHDLPRMFLSADTTPMEYISVLKGDGSPMNWMFLVDRYVAASDKGNWSIYCEKENDIAAFAFRESLSREARSQVEKLFQAKSVQLISQAPTGKSFDFNELVPKWRYALAREYLASRSS